MSALNALNAPSLWISRVVPFHYVWVIVVALAMAQMIGLAVGWAAGVLVTPLQDEFGFEIEDIGLSFGLFYLAAAFFAPIAGWLGDRYGARKVMLFSAILYTVTLVLVAFMDNLWSLHLSFGILRGIAQVIFMVPLMAGVALWFNRRLGLGTGVLWAASGIGSAVFAPLLPFMVGNLGWQNSFLLICAILGSSLLLLAIPLRNTPEEMGLKPYGWIPGDEARQKALKSIEKIRLKVFNQHVRRTKAFWNLPCIHGLGCAGHGIIMLFLVPLAVDDRGISLGTAAFTLTIISSVSIISRFVTPILCERKGTKLVMATCLLLQGLPVVLLFWADSVWEFFLFSAIFGLGFGGEWTGYLVINRQYYGNGPMGTLYGWQNTGSLLAHAFVSWAAGMMIALTGSYTAILIFSLATSLGGAALVMALEPTSQRLISPNWEDDLPVEARSATPAVAMADD